MASAAQYQGSVSFDVVAGGTKIIALDGDFDAANSADIEQRLFEASGPELTDILIDLRGVSFLDSKTVQVLVRGVTRARERGIGFALIRPNPVVWRMFVLAGLSTLFLSYSSLHEALFEH